MIFLIFHVLIIFYENFMTLIYEENDIFLFYIFIINLKFIYLPKNIHECKIIGFQ